MGGPLRKTRSPCSAQGPALNWKDVELWHWGKISFPLTPIRTPSPTSSRECEPGHLADDLQRLHPQKKPGGGATDMALSSPLDYTEKETQETGRQTHRHTETDTETETQRRGWCTLASHWHTLCPPHFPHHCCLRFLPLPPRCQLTWL